MISSRSAGRSQGLSLSELLGATLQLLEGPDFASDRIGSQLYVSQFGNPVVNVAVGAGGAGREMTTASRIMWQCCSKLMLLIPLARELAAAGADEDELVQAFIPEYAVAGKGTVTLAHLLTHTVPYQSLGLSWTDGRPHQEGEEPVLTAPSWEAALAWICQTPLRRAPGEEVVYTNVSNWIVLAEVLQRLTGRRHEDLVRDQVLQPLGMRDTSMYLTKESLPGVELAPLWQLDDVQSPVVPVVDTGQWRFSRWPGVGCRGSARDMARPLECLAGWAAADQLDPAWRAKLIQPRRTDLTDPLFEGADVWWGLGLCADPMVFGLPLGRRAIGHTGMRSSIVCADLDTGVTISFLSTGMFLWARDWARKRRLIKAVFESLSLADQLHPQRSAAAPRR
jgi:CubicO group peptidase (beta-lactamase class C family)